MMRRLFPAIAALIGGFLPRFIWTLPSLSMPSLGRFGGRRKGSNAAIKRQATKRRNIAKRLPLRKRR
jgi:hypothetical protein